MTVTLNRLIAASLTLLAATLTAACATVPPPAAEVGVAFDRNGEIGSFADGIADPQTRRPVTPDDPVRVASVSKLVVAVGVMKLVETGKLDLDSDVSTYLGWPLRNPAFPDRPVTLRMLLSHTSSVRDHDDQYAIALGHGVREMMADPRSWDQAHGPGENYFTYGNLNFPIVGSIVERATGERFDIWMRARGARTNEARRLLQLADVQRFRGRPRGRARLAGGQAEQGRSPRPAARLPGVRQ